MKNPTTTYHAIFYIIIIRKNNIRQKKNAKMKKKKCKKSSIIRKFSSSFPSASAQTSPKSFFERMSKAGFSDSNTNDTSLKGKRRKKKENIKPFKQNNKPYCLSCNVRLFRNCRCVCFNKRKIFVFFFFFSGEINRILYYMFFLKVTFKIFSLNSHFLENFCTSWEKNYK